MNESDGTRMPQTTRKAVLFDMGNTLVEYWPNPDWPDVLAEAIDACTAHLGDRVQIDADEIARRTEAQRHVRKGLEVAPLARRLEAIYDLSADQAEALCEVFMGPIFARGRLCDDSLEVLGRLRECGVGTAILSNSPWGSPAGLWQAEMRRLGLAEAVDLCVFCGQVGWRKPDRRAFEYVLQRLGLQPGDCLFVGDDPRWDVQGPEAIGMDAVLIDRTGRAEGAIHSLRELLDRPDLPG
jgi:FMN phosphatase YigB (HAD superfamily)